MKKVQAGKEKKPTTTRELQALLKDLKITLDCGHSCTVGHNFANTMVILSEGGGNIRTLCHSCY
jgi:hypothetical protein